MVSEQQRDMEQAFENLFVKKHGKYEEEFLSYMYVHARWIHDLSLQPESHELPTTIGSSYASTSPVRCGRLIVVW